MSRRFRETPKSEMDAQREMLDELMGVNRNMDRAEDEINDYQVSFIYLSYINGSFLHSPTLFLH
jgi:hypothetical protein